MEKNVHKNFLFTHGADSANRRYTLAAKLNKDGFTIGAAVCSDQDNFCRKIGRNIAKTRAVGRPIKSVDFSEDQIALGEKERRHLAIEQMFGIKSQLEADATIILERNQ